MSKNKINTFEEAFSWTTAVAGKQWDPTVGRTPFNVVTGMGLNNNLSKNVGMADEKTQKADRILPFPLDRVVEQLVISYESLMKTRGTLLASVRSALLTKEERNLLRKDMKLIDDCVKNIRVISRHIEEVKIGY